MNYQEDSFRNESDQSSQQQLQMIDTLKAPIVEMGLNLGYEVVEDSELVSPIHACWTFRPGSEFLRDMRSGSICTHEMVEDEIMIFFLFVSTITVHQKKQLQ